MKIKRFNIRNEKEPWYYKLMDTKLWKLVEIWLDIVCFFESKLYKIKRSLAYAKFGWNNHDFDSIFLFDLILFKLKRIKKECMEDVDQEVSTAQLKSINIAIKLIERLIEKPYGYTFARDHDAKWGELMCRRVPYSFDEEGKPDSYKVELKRARVTNDDEREQELKENREVMYIKEKLEKQDVRRLLRIIEKYHDSWWD